jgi:hypothetical protein
MHIDDYEHTGEELLDLFDELISAEERTRFHLELYNERRMAHNGEVPAGMMGAPRRLEHAAGKLRDTHEELDTLFQEEHPKFPIQTVSRDENGNESHGITWYEIEMDSYSSVVNALEEVSANLGERDPHIDYSEAPAPFAMIDYSDELIHAYRRIEATYQMLEEAGV